MADVPVSDPTYTLTSYDEPTREGYMFCGWSTSSTGAVQYRTNDQITLDGNLTLYAVWDGLRHHSTQQPTYDIIDFHIEGAMLYFRARKK